MQCTIIVAITCVYIDYVMIVTFVFMLIYIANHYCHVWWSFTEYKLVQYTDRGYAEKVPQLTVKGVGLVSTHMYMYAQ